MTLTKRHAPQHKHEHLIVKKVSVNHQGANKEGEGVDAQLDDLDGAGRDATEERRLLCIGKNLAL